MNPDLNLQNVRLKCPCPPNCKCGGKISYEWVHQKCGNPTYITSKGDLFCNTKGCSTYFIRNAKFKCDFLSETWSQFREIREFAMALAMAIQSGSFNLTDNDLVNFITSINTEVAKRWNQ